MARNERTTLEKQLWGLGITQGVLAILFGILALFWPGITVALLIVFFGVFVLVWGIVGIIVSLSSIGTSKFWWLELIFSLLAVGLAVFMLRNPIDTAAIFILLIGLTFLVRGLIDLLGGLFDRSRTSDNRIFSVIAGIIGIIAGIVTLLYPISAGIAVVWVVGLYGVLYGALTIAFSFRATRDLK